MMSKLSLRLRVMTTYTWETNEGSKPIEQKLSKVQGKSHRGAFLNVVILLGHFEIMKKAGDVDPANWFKYPALHLDQ